MKTDIDVKTLRVAVLSPSPNIRTQIKTKLINTGVIDIQTIDSVEEARTLFESTTPDAFITEWSIDKEGDGLELIDSLRNTPRLLQMATIVITSYIDQDHIAQAVFHDVDEYLAKPYTGKALDDALLRAVGKRHDPSPFTTGLRHATTLLIQKQYADAHKEFHKASRMRPELAIPHFYLGFIECIFNRFDQALNEFENGVKKQPQHLKCQLGRAFLLGKLKRRSDYFESLREVLAIFPAHGNAVSEILPLALERNELGLASRTLKHMLAVHREFPRLIPTLQRYALAVTEALVKSRQLEALQGLLPALKEFARGRESFQQELLDWAKSRNVESLFVEKTRDTKKKTA